MSYEDFEPDQYEIPDGYISAGEALQHVQENQWDEVLSLVNDERNETWLRENKPFVDLLSIISRQDKDQLRDLIRLGISAQNAASADDVSDAHLFSVAGEVCSFLENLSKCYPRHGQEFNQVSGQYWVDRRPDPVDNLVGCLEFCSLEGDLGWSREIVAVTRMCRDFLFAAGDPFDPLFRSQKLGILLKQLNDALQRNSNNRVVYWYAADKGINFGRVPGTRQKSLALCVSDWFSDYLIDFYPSLSLAACMECGIFFERHRRDNVYCSKTCQNRVAYKRKKILETDALSKVQVGPDTAGEIKPGLLFYHSRLGLGIVEAVDFERGAMLDLLPAGATESFKEKLSAYRAKSIRMRVLFPHGVRNLNYAEIFEVRKEEALHQFYSVSQREIVAGLF